MALYSSSALHSEQINIRPPSMLGVKYAKYAIMAKSFSFSMASIRAAAGGEDFQILSEEGAREWAEKKLSAEEYCKIFGEPEEG